MFRARIRNLLNKLKGFFIKKETQDAKKTKTEIETKTLESLLNSANNIINNAKNGILINIDGKVIYDLRSDFKKINQILERVMIKRIRTGIRENRAAKPIHISSNDIKAVLFKPITKNIETDNDEIKTGNSLFSQWWGTPPLSLDPDFYNAKLSSSILNNVIEISQDRIEVFMSDVLSLINNIPAFIDALLEQLPTAFGEPSV